MQCSISNSSLKFARNASGLLILAAYLLHSVELAIAIAAIMLLGAFSIKTNILYQFYYHVVGKGSKEKLNILEKDGGEVIFSWTMGGVFVVIGLILIYFNLVTLGWIFILITSMLMFCAGFLNFCVASMMYAVFKKMIQNTKK